MVQKLSYRLDRTITARDVVVCPPFTALRSVQTVIEADHSDLGAQDVHWQQSAPTLGPCRPGCCAAWGCAL
jgi:triosephosphate isomerase